MLGFKRVTVAQHERGLVFRNQSFNAILEPGVYWIFNPLKRVEVQIYDLTVTEFEHPRVDFLVKEARATIEKHFTIVELGDRDVGVVYKNGRVAGLVAPGKRQLYWRGPVDVRVDKFDFSKEFELPRELAKVLVRAKQPLAALVADAVVAAEVADTAVGLLTVDGELAKVLEPGLHASHNAGVEGSSPSLSTNDLRALSITRRKVGVGVSRDPTILFVASINRPISAAL